MGQCQVFVTNQSNQQQLDSERSANIQENAMLQNVHGLHSSMNYQRFLPNSFVQQKRGIEQAAAFKQNFNAVLPPMHQKFALNQQQSGPERVVTLQEISNLRGPPPPVPQGLVPLVRHERVLTFQNSALH